MLPDTGLQQLCLLLSCLCQPLQHLHHFSHLRRIFEVSKVSNVGKFKMWESFKCGKVSNVGEFQKWESFLTWLLLSSLLCRSSTKGEVWPNLRIKIQETFKSWENKMLSSSCKDSRLSNFNQWESFSEQSLKIPQICFSHFYSKFPFLIDRCQHILLKKSLYTAQVKMWQYLVSEYLKWAPKPKGGLGVPDSWDTFRKGKLI